MTMMRKQGQPLCRQAIGEVFHPHPNLSIEGEGHRHKKRRFAACRVRIADERHKNPSGKAHCRRRPAGEDSRGLNSPALGERPPSTVPESGTYTTSTERAFPFSQPRVPAAFCYSSVVLSYRLFYLTMTDNFATVELPDGSVTVAVTVKTPVLLKT